VHHRLFIAEYRILQARVLLERLSYPGDVPVSEDPKTARKKWSLPSVSLDILILEEPEDALRDCQASLHRLTSSALSTLYAQLMSRTFEIPTFPAR
jgi:hypothetical protein